MSFVIKGSSQLLDSKLGNLSGILSPKPFANRAFLIEGLYFIKKLSSLRVLKLKENFYVFPRLE